MGRGLFCCIGKEEKRKKEVVANLKTNFPDMDKDTLNEVLSCVIF